MTQNTSACLGILMLDSRFPRPRGDAGNAQTWNFPVRYSVVPGATPHAIVESDASPFLNAFVTAGRDLIAQGCTGIATTCGFLTPFRTELASQLGVPVAASALEQAAMIRTSLPKEQRLGVLTISKSALKNAHLIAAGVPPDTVIEGVESTSFARSILGNSAELDITQARDEMVIAAKAMLANTPEVGAILLECTNMVPYAPDIQRATNLPVYSIYSYLNWFHQSLSPRIFPSV